MADPLKSAVNMSCAEQLIQRIQRDGPISIACFMETAVDAYYGRGDVFGRSGDFITAPEISQVFGELVGLWCITAWQGMGQPRDFHLVECGPGRGTLMADIVRTVNRTMPKFAYAASLHLIERSALLRKVQRDTLTNETVTWHDDFTTLPDGPVIFVANEFLDALPITQHIKTSSGWCERLVTHNGNEFKFATAPLPSPDVGEAFDDVPIGSILESSSAVREVIHDISKLCAERSGVALMIDYGYTHTDIGDTLQAVKKHTYHPVLKDPGTADLTAHVDFALVSEAARSGGCVAYGPIEQGLWLTRLGVKVREAQLSEGKPDKEAKNIQTSITRLIDPKAMGSLFKVLAIAPAHVPPLNGFGSGEM